MADLQDHLLSKRISELSSNIAALHGQVELVNRGVGTVQRTTSETRNDLSELRAEFDEFRNTSQRLANVQRAEIKIGAVQDTIGREFGHHEVVRRSATGMLQAFDIGLVSEETVRNISEQLMIENPRYWLAPALVALSAWSSDNPGLCDKAVAEAYRRSPDKCALFFALITRRQGRFDASIRWLRHYLNTQDPTRLGRDFATVLEAVSQGAFSAAARDMVQDVLAKWSEELLSDDNTIKSQIANWHHEVVSYSASTRAPRYPNLAALSPQWPSLDTALTGASAHEPLRAKYDDLLHADIRPSDRLEDAVDDILDTLVKEYDVDELPRRRELAALEAIIAHDGDLAQAQVTGARAQSALGETLDYLTIQTSSALTPGEIGVSKATQRVAVGACADWFRAAHDQHSKEYRAAIPSDVQASFGGSQPVAERIFTLPPWSSSFNRPLAELESSLKNHWDTHARPWIDALRYNWQKACIAPALAMFVILILIGQVSLAFAVVAALVVGGVWALIIRSRYQKAEAAVAQATTILDDAKKKAVHELRSARAELDDWQLEFRDRDAEAPKVHTLIEDFRGTQGSATSAFERRAVNTEGWS